LTRWSLPRLAAYLAEQQIVQGSPAHLVRVLAEANLCFQRTRTWNASPDPDYEAKAARVLELTRRAPEDDGVVIASDQIGPVSLRPTAPGGGAPNGRPQRQRADYNRRQRTRYVFGAFDMHADRLRVRLRRRRICWIQDNLSANWTPDIRRFAASNRIELVATPTYASYLNPVECHFTPISQFAVARAD
jgi:hypothetical protein